MNALCRLSLHKPDKDKVIHLPANYGGRVKPEIHCTRCGKKLGEAKVLLDL